jgi:hypothetical protein
MAQNSRIDSPIAGYVGVAHACGYHLDEKLIFVRLARQKIFVFPLVLRVGDYAFAGYSVFGHGMCRQSAAKVEQRNTLKRGGVRILDVDDVMSRLLDCLFSRLSWCCGSDAGSIVVRSSRRSLRSVFRPMKVSRARDNG